MKGISVGVEMKNIFTLPKPSNSTPSNAHPTLNRTKDYRVSSAGEAQAKEPIENTNERAQHGERLQQLIHSTFEFFLSLSSSENILLHSIIVLLTILDNAQNTTNYCRSCLGNLFTSRSLRLRSQRKLEEGSRPRDTWAIARDHNGNRTERFIIELNGSAILHNIFLPFTPRLAFRLAAFSHTQLEALEINWKKILSFNFWFRWIFCFIRVPSSPNDLLGRFLKRTRADSNRFVVFMFVLFAFCPRWPANGIVGQWWMLDWSGVRRILARVLT